MANLGGLKNIFVFNKTKQSKGTKLLKNATIVQNYYHWTLMAVKWKFKNDCLI